MKENWTYRKFEDCLEKVKYTSKISTSDYQEEGKYPIVSQEEGLIAGFWNKEADVFKTNKPVVIFGDHTRILKYVDFDFVLGADGVKILQPTDGLSAKFLLYYLQWCNIPSLGYSRHYKLLKEIEVPIPIIEAQSRIVSELDLLQSVIDKQKAQLKELDNLAQSIFYDMFGDPVENEKGWSLKTMEDVCLNIIDCPHSTPKKSNRITDYPCIRTSELKEGNIYWDSMQYLEEDEYIIRIARLKPIAGDIVFGREGTIGDAVILPDGYNFSLGQRTMLLRVDDSSISNIFLQRVILSECVKKQIRMVNVSSTVPHVNIKDFKRFEIPVPPLALQQSFAAKIESIEKQKTAISRSITETQKLFDYAMDKYFGE